MNSTHKISKLIFEVSLPGDENQAKVLQLEIEQIISKHIAKVLDKALSKFDEENVDYIIDKLEIDIGSFDLKNGKEKLFREIAEKVEQGIQKTTKNGEVQKELSEVKSRTKDASELELVFYVLRNGHFPWWADFDKKINVNDFFKQFIKKPSSKLRALLKNELSNPTFRKRMINYLTEKELIDCIEVLIPSILTNNKLIIEQCISSLSFKTECFNLLFQLPNNNSHIIEIIKNSTELFQYHNISPKTINLDVLQLPNDLVSRLELIQLSIIKTKGINSSDLDGNDTAIKEKKKIKDDRDNQLENYRDDETQNSIEINNAGLVLTLPFVARFFENIGIVKNQEFNSESEQHYAVYLLHYIATGIEDSPQEHELFFEKLICGVDDNEVLKPYKVIDKKHIAEVEELLKAIIENWKALKSSSPQTLRTAFIQRSGFLIHRDDGAWSLHIKRQTIDILLDKIPWTVSVNRLPFNNLMIYTEW